MKIKIFPYRFVFKSDRYSRLHHKANTLCHRLHIPFYDNFNKARRSKKRLERNNRKPDTPDSVPRPKLFRYESVRIG